MDVVSYKGYQIYAKTLQNLGEWTVAVEIRRHRNNKTRSRHFPNPDRHPTRKEAVAHCFTFGKQIIDGQAENCAVRDL